MGISTQMTGDKSGMPRLSIRKSLRKMSNKSVEDVVKQGDERRAVCKECAEESKVMDYHKQIRWTERQSENCRSRFIDGSASSQSWLHILGGIMVNEICAAPDYSNQLPSAAEQAWLDSKRAARRCADNVAQIIKFSETIVTFIIYGIIFNNFLLDGQILRVKKDIEDRTCNISHLGTNKKRRYQFTWSSIALLIAQVIVNTFFTYPLVYADIPMDILGTRMYYRLESIMCALMFLRLYHIWNWLENATYLRYFDLEDSYMVGDHATIVMSQESATSHRTLAFKVAMTRNPGSIVLFVVFLLLGSMTYIMRIAEGPAYMPHSVYIWDQIRCISVADASIGYSSSVPKTHIGRMAAVVVMLWMPLIIAFITASTTKKLNLNPDEEKMMVSIDNNRLKMIAMNSAARVIQFWWRKLSQSDRFNKKKFNPRHQELKRLELMRKLYKVLHDVSTLLYTDTITGWRQLKTNVVKEDHAGLGDLIGRPTKTKTSLPSAAAQNRLSELKLPSRQPEPSMGNFPGSQYSLDDLVDEIRILKDKHSRLEAMVLEVLTVMRFVLGNSERNAAEIEIQPSLSRRSSYMSRGSNDDLLEFAKRGSFSYKHNAPLKLIQPSDESDSEQMNERLRLPARRTSVPYDVPGPETPAMSPKLFPGSESEEEEEIRISALLPPRKPRRSSESGLRSTATSVQKPATIDLRKLEPISPDRFHKAHLSQRNERQEMDRQSTGDSRMSFRNRSVSRSRSRSSSPTRRDSAGKNMPSLLPIETNDVDEAESEILFTRARTLNTMNGNHSSAKIMTNKATPMTMTPRLVEAQRRAMERTQGSSYDLGTQKITSMYRSDHFSLSSLTFSTNRPLSAANASRSTNYMPSYREPTPRNAHLASMSPRRSQSAEEGGDDVSAKVMWMRAQASAPISSRRMEAVTHQSSYTSTHSMAETLLQRNHHILGQNGRAQV
eukprot:747845-Hanusia_phi.AAC.6